MRYKLQHTKKEGKKDWSDFFFS